MDSKLLKFKDKIKDCFLAEIPQFSLWMPVFFAVGILIYFSLPAEPSYSLISLGAIPVFAFGLFAYNNQAMRYGVTVLILIWLGMIVSKVRTDSLHTHFIAEEYKGVVQGVVEKIEYMDSTARLTLKDVKLTFRRAPKAPQKVRIRLLNGEKMTPNVGDRIQIYGQISPPPPPAMPGGFDFQRFMYFKSIGAVGFAMGHPKILEENTQKGFFLFFDHLRAKLTGILKDSLPDEEARVAIALLTGDKNPIKKKTLEEIRASGLAHLLAISGLHISLVAGLFYGGIRFGLSCIPSIALRYPIKKIAAVIGLFAAIFYMLLVGSPIPTQRAMMMLGLVVLAVLTDREALTLRLVSLAAFVVLVIAPESVVSPSFQMSFAAVACLVAFYEKYNERLFAFYEKSFWNKSLLYVLGLFTTSLISTLATSPFSLYHFNTMSVYGILANLIAVPLTAFWIMPMGILGCFLVLFGLSKYAFILMGYGIKGILVTASYVAALPGSVLIVKQMTDFSFGLIILGGLWMILWKQKWRFAGLYAILFGLAMIPFASRPDILVASQGRLIGIKQGDTLYLSQTRGERFIANIWMHAVNAKQKKLLKIGDDFEIGNLKILMDEKSLKMDDKEILAFDRLKSKEYSQAFFQKHNSLGHKKDIEIRGKRPWVRKTSVN